MDRSSSPEPAVATPGGAQLLLVVVSGERASAPRPPVEVDDGADDDGEQRETPNCAPDDDACRGRAVRAVVVAPTAIAAAEAARGSVVGVGL